MMERIKRILEQYGLHCFLLPLFFVLHNYTRYYGLASAGVAFRLWIVTEAIFIGFFLVLLLITRHASRSAQITTLLGFIALFYGVVKDFFSDTLHTPFLSKYTVLLPLTVVLAIWAIVRVCKKKDFRKTNFFQNMLLILFVAMDGLILIRYGNPFMQNNELVNHNILKPDTLALPAARPDVYFLVFDSYPGTDFLKEYVQYDNTRFDTMLRSKGFYVTAHPKSNYTRTAFSIASTLNFEFLQTITANTHIEPRHYTQATLGIEHATVPAVFMRAGYEVYNLSVFDLAGHPALWREDFMVLPGKQMLLYNTLAERIRRDVLWHFPYLQYGHVTNEKLRQNEDAFIEKNYLKKDFNNRAIDSLLKIPSLPSQKPRFVYAHFYLPHPPFFYDSSGRSIDIDFNTLNASMEDKKAFISYLQYTNKVIEKITGALLADTQRRPVVLIQSDHGYRDFRKDEVKPASHHMNYSAFYFPDGNYTSLYDSISNVNTFPVLFNKYFNTHIHLQPDSQVSASY